MMNSEDFSELAALDSLDLLEASEAQEMEAAIATSPELAEELAAFQAAAAAIAYTVPTVPMAANLKNRLFARIQAEVAAPAAVDSVLSSRIAELKQQAETVSWEAYPLAAGIMIGTFHLDVTQRKIACFVRAGSQVRFPNHLHAGDEEIMVLEGDLVIDGKVYGVGDCIRSVAGTAHIPETLQGCLLFLQTSLDDKILT